MPPLFQRTACWGGIWAYLTTLLEAERRQAGGTLFTPLHANITCCLWQTSNTYAAALPSGNSAGQAGVSRGHRASRRLPQPAFTTTPARLFPLLTRPAGRRSSLPTYASTAPPRGSFPTITRMVRATADADGCPALHRRPPPHFPRLRAIYHRSARYCARATRVQRIHRACRTRLPPTCGITYVPRLHGAKACSYR